MTLLHIRFARLLLRIAWWLGDCAEAILLDVEAQHRESC